MTSDRRSRRVYRWINRPYVAHRANGVGPRMTNFGAVLLTVFIQGSALTVRNLIPIDVSLDLILLPSVVILFLTAVLWLTEPPSRRSEVNNDD